MQSEHGLVGVVLAGISFIALTYVLLNHASNVASIARHSAASYGDVAATFQGK